MNSAFAACDKLSLRALDELVWSAAFLMRSVMQRGEVRVKLSLGEEIVGPLNFSGKPIQNGADHS